jgi:hypothetical protein
MSVGANTSDGQAAEAIRSKTGKGIPSPMFSGIVGLMMPVNARLGG